MESLFTVIIIALITHITVQSELKPKPNQSEYQNDRPFGLDFEEEDNEQNDQQTERKNDTIIDNSQLFSRRLGEDFQFEDLLPFVHFNNFSRYGQYAEIAPPTHFNRSNFEQAYHGRHLEEEAEFERDERWQMENDDYELHDYLVNVYNEKTEICCSTSVYPLQREFNQSCCGTEVYDQTENECCGDFVYNPDSDMDCCNNEPFSKMDAACCLSDKTGEGVIVKKSKHNHNQQVQCCGPMKLFNVNSEVCCPYRRYKLPEIEEIPLTQMIHFTRNSRDMQKELNMQLSLNYEIKRYQYYLRRMPVYKVLAKNNFGQDTKCWSRNHDEQPKPFTFQGTYYTFENVPGNCNGQPFNLITQICCLVENEDGYQSKLHAKTSYISQCCGLEKYDFSDEICCNNRVYAQNEDTSLLCCGDKAYDFTEKRCCENSHSTMTINSLMDLDSCCSDNKVVFSSHTEMCCGTEVVMKDSGKICCKGLHLEFTGVEKCCGNLLYNPRNEICCEENIFTKTAASEQCCGSRKYDIYTHICCEDERNKIVRRNAPHDTACCGDSTYNFETETCCLLQNGPDPEIFEIAIHKKKSYQYACCGLQLYNISTQHCCVSTVVDSEQIAFAKQVDVLRCCGNSTYDPETEVCCNDTVVPAPASYLECCGVTTYDPEIELCCKGIVYKPENKKRMDCCGGKMIDTFKQVCCRGATKESKNPLKATCCYNILP